LGITEFAAGIFPHNKPWQKLWQKLRQKENLLDINLDLSIPQPSPLNNTVTSQNLNLHLLYHDRTINAVVKEVNTIARALLPEHFC